MIDLSGYSFEKMHQDGNFILFRGRRQGDSASLLLLAATLERPPSSTLDLTKHIYSLRDELDSAWTTRPLKFPERRGIPELALDDPGGDFLEPMTGRPLARRECLRLALTSPSPRPHLALTSPSTKLYNPETPTHKSSPSALQTINKKRYNHEHDHEFSE